MIRKVLVLGGGSAGYLAAISLKRRIPQLDVTVVRSKALGVIGVGEGTTFTIPNYMHGYLGIDPQMFHQRVHPTYKLGIRFLWGPRSEFFYTFTSQLDARYPQLPQPNGFYCRDTFDYADLTGALMAQNKAFERQDDGGPLIRANLAYHLENALLVEFLEEAALAADIVVEDELLEHVELDEHGVRGLRYQSGRTASADLYIDCSGFRSELLGRALEEPYIPFTASLYCDRAVVGGWRRTTEPLRPYTTSESMDAGWAWQIEHDDLINRGYVFSSAFLSDDEAAAELKRKNPLIGETRVVPFRTGRYQRAWVHNVVAIGNAAGFVEPLEATALAVICDHSAALVRTLLDCGLTIRPTQRAMFNEHNAWNWDCIRRFLALHYKFNTRLETPFWRACRADVDLAGAEPIVAYYQENGPSLIWAHRLLGVNDPFGWEGYLALLVGQQVPYSVDYQPSLEEWSFWRRQREELGRRATASMTQEEALPILRSDRWTWRPDFYPSASQW